MHPKPNTTKASKHKNPYQHAFSKALQTRHGNSLTFVPMTMQWTRTYHWPLEDNPGLARNTFWPSDHRGHRRCPLKSLTNGIMHCSHHHNQHCYGRCQHQHGLPSSFMSNVTIISLLSALPHKRYMIKTGRWKSLRLWQIPLALGKGSHRENLKLEG